MSTNLTTLSHKMVLIVEAMEKLTSAVNGQGRTEIFRRVSHASRQSFRVPEINTASPVTPKVIFKVNLSCK